MWEKAPKQIYWFTTSRGREHGDPAGNAVHGWVSDKEPASADVTQVAKYVPEPMWLPISTAPRDGRFMQLRNKLGHSLSGYYSEVIGMLIPEVLIDDQEDFSAFEFTHWMPMPEEPKC